MAARTGQADPRRFSLSERADFDGRAYQDRHDHSAFLHRKVEATRLSSRAEQGRSDEAVEADFAARRARVTDQA